MQINTHLPWICELEPKGASWACSYPMDLWVRAHRCLAVVFARVGSYGDNVTNCHSLKLQYTIFLLSGFRRSRIQDTYYFKTIV